MHLSILNMIILMQDLNTSQFADDWYGNSRFCQIPEIPSTAGLNSNRFPANNICQVSRADVHQSIVYYDPFQ